MTEKLVVEEVFRIPGTLHPCCDLPGDIACRMFDEPHKLVVINMANRTECLCHERDADKIKSGFDLVERITKEAGFDPNTTSFDSIPEWLRAKIKAAIRQHHAQTVKTWPRNY